MRKGIILAGGSGSRLFPITKAISKQLLPIYDKPLIYYPLSTLMYAQVRDILIIVSSKENEILFNRLLGDGFQWGINISYAIQDRPGGLAQAFIIGKDFIGNDSSVLALGDNIFYGEMFCRDITNIDDNTIFGCKVKDPSAYGVAIFDQDRKIIGVVEKPKVPPSNWAIPGLYFYDNSVVDRALSLKPSERGELEITDLNNTYIKEGKLNFRFLPEGTAWFDTGTHDHLLEAAQFVKVIQSRTGVMIANLDRIATYHHWNCVMHVPV